MNAFLGMVITNGFIKKDGQIIKLTKEQEETLGNMRKSLDAFINQHVETDKKFKEVREAIWENKNNILENKNRFSEIEQRIIEHENEIEKAFQEVDEHIDSNVKQINSEIDSLKQTIAKHNDKAEQKFQEAHQQIDSNAKLISSNADKINSLEQTIITQRKAISELEELKAHKTRLYIISIISTIIAIASLVLHFIEV